MNPTNYSVSAVREFWAILQRAGRGRENDRANLDYLVDCLERGIHFALPDHGLLIERPRKIGNVSAIAKPPFPVTILEYAATGESIPGHPDYKTEKRIVVATDDGDKVTIVPINSAPSNMTDRRWLTPVIFIQIEYNQTGETTRYGYSEFFPDLFATLNHDDKASAINDAKALAQGCIEAYLEFCEVLACSNVSHETIKAPYALNNARFKRGKILLKDYHILTINGANPKASLQGDGSRQVRSHLRRGHIRRLQSGKRTWVNSCIVNGGAEGFVSKDYKVSPRLYTNA